MKKLSGNKNNAVSPKQLFDFFTMHEKIEQERITNQKKVMEEKLLKVTKGKNIVISNYSKLDMLRLTK